MPYQPSPPPKLFAVAIAALVATSVTANLALLLVFLGDLPDTLLTNIDFGSLLGGLLPSVVILSFFAALFGFVGAAVFLGVALLPLRRRSFSPYVLAGALAGLAHSGCGLALDFAIGDSNADRGGVLDTIQSWGGFFLTRVPGVGMGMATFAASMVGGGLAGLAYAALIGVKRRDVE